MPDNTAPLLVRVCQGETVDRPPVWLMRQAGRYLPEYQAIRGQVSFLGLCKDVDLACEVSLQPLRRFGMDAVIMFSDILIPVEAMGMALEFTEKGPVLPQPLRHPDDLKQLSIPDPIEKTGFVMEILKRLRTELATQPDVALIGFAGAPWTLASYMIEGGVSRNFREMKRWMYSSPETLHQLLDIVSDTVIEYLKAQIAAGAQTLQLFDSWAGTISRAQYQEFVLPYHQKVINSVRTPEVPMVLYANNSRGLLDLMAQSGADVISVDWMTSLTDARSIVGAYKTLQGNLDPDCLFLSAEHLKPRVELMLEEAGNTRYIANLGHGVLQHTPIDNVALFVDTVKTYRTQKAKQPVGV